jgi:uncharacterized protein Yka (UPF0111/DUF47 family)
MHLTGLTDDYVPDGRVITEVLSDAHGQLSSTQAISLGECYKQLNSSVGAFGTATMQADTAAIGSSSSSDATYLATVASLSHLEKQRDHLAETIKQEFFNAEFRHKGLHDVHELTESCQTLIDQASGLAISPGR